MRGSVVAIALALLGGCSPDEPRDTVSPLAESPEPEYVLEPTQRPDEAPNTEANSLEELLRQVEVQRASSPSPLFRQRPRRLVFECIDDVSFAVELVDESIAVFAPGLPANSFLTLGRVPSDSGLHYQAGDTDFWSKGDLATLRMGHEQYVDCVSNPAAAVWRAEPRGDIALR